MFAHVQKHKFRNVLWSKSYCLVVVFILEKDSRESKKINHKMKILTVAFIYTLIQLSGHSPKTVMVTVIVIGCLNI